MTYDQRPYIGAVRIQDWITKDKQRIRGIRIVGASGIAGHLTASEALELADKLVDLAERLPEATTVQPARQQTSCGLAPIYTSQTLTAADGTPEQPLPATHPE